MSGILTELSRWRQPRVRRRQAAHAGGDYSGRRKGATKTASSIHEVKSMRFEDEDDSASPAIGGRPAGVSEALLRAEIGFWRELLQECDQSMPPDSVERMRQALALAERRFLQLCREAGARDRSNACPRGTSPVGGKYLH